MFAPRRRLDWPRRLYGASAAQAQQAPAELDGYRLTDFRAPVPETLENATVLDDDAALALWRTGTAIFIDVFPQPAKPENLPEDTLWISPRRMTIPGAAWLPNTGFGALTKESAAYLRESLARLTEADPSKADRFLLPGGVLDVMERG